MICGSKKNIDKYDAPLDYHPQPRNMYGRPIFENSEGKELNAKQLKKDLSKERKDNDKIKKVLEKENKNKEHNSVLGTPTNKIHNISENIRLHRSDEKMNDNGIEKKNFIGKAKDKLINIAGKMRLHRHSDEKIKQNHFDEDTHMTGFAKGKMHDIADLTRLHHHTDKQQKMEQNPQKKNLLGAAKEKLHHFAEKIKLHHHTDEKKKYNEFDERNRLNQYGYYNQSSINQIGNHQMNQNNLNMQHGFDSSRQQQNYLGYQQQSYQPHYQGINQNLNQEQRITQDEKDIHMLGFAKGKIRDIAGLVIPHRSHEQKEVDPNHEKKNFIGMAKDKIHHFAEKIKLHHHSDEKKNISDSDERNNLNRNDIYNHQIGTQSPQSQLGSYRQNQQINSHIQQNNFGHQQISDQHYNQGINQNQNLISSSQNNYQFGSQIQSSLAYPQSDLSQRTHNKINEQGLYDQFHREQNHHMNNYEFVDGYRQ